MAAKPIPVPGGPFGTACLASGPPSAEWAPLLDIASGFGWPVSVPVG